MDKDGFLDYGEFVAISVHLRKMGNDDHLRKAFEFFDKNETGYIEIDELRLSLTDEAEAMSEEVINAIIQDVDTDKVSFLLEIIRKEHKLELKSSKKLDYDDELHCTFFLTDQAMILQDGRISYEEFAAMMKAGTDWRKASRQYSRERYNSLSLKLMKEMSTNEER